jgi:hypothetical protein
MKRLDSERRELVAAALCEGDSIPATARLTGAAYTTVLRFVEDMGCACQLYLDEHMRNLPCRRLQCDGLWAFVAAKEKNVTEAMRRQVKAARGSAGSAPSGRSMFPVPPARPGRFLSNRLPLLRRELRRPRLPTLRRPEPPKGDRDGILPLGRLLACDGVDEPVGDLVHVLFGGLPASWLACLGRHAAIMAQVASGG